MVLKPSWRTPLAALALAQIMREAGLPDGMVTIATLSPADTEEIGPEEHGDHWVYRYKRCRVCGFTVRVVLRTIPDAALLASVRKILSTTFQRNSPT